MEELTHMNNNPGDSLLPTILLIDDEPAVREVWSDFLTGRGHRVLTAENGLVGIELFEKYKEEIGVVILDMVMPKLGGKATFDRLKEIKPSVKVLITSGYSEEGQDDEITLLEKDAFVQKPIQLSLLQKKINEVLGK
jgi:two-component system, cell cycle sensor histidine kinase and response regulator CckA